MIIVSDTSPISNLLKIGQIGLLREIYQAVVIPEAVWEELKAAQDLNLTEVLASDWVSIKEITDRVFFDSLLVELDAGEAAAIVLAQELNADILLMDERSGRQKALSLGLHVTGVVGILLTAKGLG